MLQIGGKIVMIRTIELVVFWSEHWTVWIYIMKDFDNHQLQFKYVKLNTNKTNNLTKKMGQRL